MTKKKETDENKIPDNIIMQGGTVVLNPQAEINTDTEKVEPQQHGNKIVNVLISNDFPL